MKTIISLMVTVCLTAIPGLGRVLRVPADYATIQLAVDSTQDGDTVLVAVGVYSESVLLPGHLGMLMGDVVPDTGSYPRPVIDPSPLPNSSRLACLYASAGTWTIEDFVFRNRRPMYPHTGCGGVYAGRHTRLRRCLFDSTYESIESHTGVIMEECRFSDVQGRGISPTTPHITATDCEFTGNCPWAIVWCGDSCTFDRCWFHDNTAQQELVVAYGRDIVFRNCLFGPYRLTMEQPLMLDVMDCLLEGNVFRYCHQNWEIVQVACSCSHPTVFRGNTFLCDPPPNLPIQPSWVVTAGCGVSGPCDGSRFGDNIFFDGDTAVGPTFIALWTDATHFHNRFTRVRPDTMCAALRAEGYVPMVTMTCLDNLLYNNGIAIINHMSLLTDARWNWWGDSTGPYHATLNPEGRGDEVRGSVLFTPWHQDTAFFNETAPERFVPTVQQASLAAYPNPFNTTARLTLRLPEPVIVRVELFDLLGRRVREVWSGAVAYWEDISLNAGDLPSGLYFARVTNTLTRAPLATTKLVLLK
jgi:hypothetical protein